MLAYDVNKSNGNLNLHSVAQKHRKLKRLYINLLKIDTNR